MRDTPIESELCCRALFAKSPRMASLDLTFK